MRTIVRGKASPDDCVFLMRDKLLKLVQGDTTDNKSE